MSPRAATRAPASLTDRLCTHCGLCCDGSLFADVSLSGPAEAGAMEALGLAIDEDAEAATMLLPCPALRGTRCSVYAHRPGTCRAFECTLLRDAARGAVTVEQALVHIAAARAGASRVRSLAVRLAPSAERLPLEEQCAEALTAAVGKGARTARIAADLETAMAGVRALVRGVFLRRSR